MTEPRHLTLRQLYWMQRAKKKHDQELSSNIARVVAEVHRNTDTHPAPFPREKFYVWNIPDFVHEANRKPPAPSISLAELKAEYNAWRAQREG